MVKEYGRLLRQLRRVIKISDKTTVDLNSKKLDLLDQVYYDVLTEIHNRRFLEENLKQMIKLIACSAGMLSVLMVDVDFFKRYNDTYGHSKGDDCLRAIAKTLNSSIKRQDDFVARYGGEEFIIVLPNTNGKDACTIADKILENIRNCNIPHRKNDAAACVTISIGVTTANVISGQNSKDFIKKADEALYIAKKEGRNRYKFLNFREETE